MGLGDDASPKFPLRMLERGLPIRACDIISGEILYSSSENTSFRIRQRSRPRARPPAERGKPGANSMAKSAIAAFFFGLPSWSFSAVTRLAFSVMIQRANVFAAFRSVFGKWNAV